ncbi:MAG: hypothetical protein GY780_00550 [bacterium]|nr:hypothetical protein [bacterium]
MLVQQHRRLPLGWVIMLVLLALGLGLTPAKAAERVHRFIKFTIQDPDGNFFPIGEVEFCTPEGKCIYADIEKDFPGHFVVPSEELERGTAYSVLIYDKQVAVHYEMNNWVYQPKDYDPGFDRMVELDKFMIYPRFHGTENGDMVFRIDTTLNPEWALRKNVSQYAGPDSTNGFPELVAGFSVPVMLGGNFTTNQDALGGIDDVRPGIGLSGSYRFGYPRYMPEMDNWIFFHELTVAYQQNRYETWEIMTPGRRSDVTFHRLKVSYGVGQMSQSFASHWSVGVTAAFGGVYDGTTMLKYLDRSYKRRGFGIKASWLQRMFQVGRVDVGASGQLELMYYSGDTSADDYWFGMAPSVSIGLVVF